MTGPPPRFSPAELTVEAGDAVFFLSNVSQGLHTFAIGPVDRSSHCALSTRVKVGDPAAFTVQGLKPGTYSFWCTVEDHAVLGMIGTITVSP